ncbi:MAG: Ppx/GppA family phosphatase [Deltaproteobacteria bacterium]|nr:Ppx/GppA family phosphatase [Deltaproteobacteria bacterium]
MMKNAVIDIGTNTLILLIAEPQSKGKIRVIRDEACITRLGQGLTDNHFFLSEAMQRTFSVLLRFKKTCDEHDVKKITAVGTAAFRYAANASVFIEKTEKECGFKINIISGEEEARHTFSAAWKDFGGNKKKLIVVDIGGGSTEIITGPQSAKKTNPETVISLQLGTVRLTELYAQSDPLSKTDFDRCLKAIKNTLKDELDDFYPPAFNPAGSVLVATAGTATTLAAMHRKMEVYDPAKVHGLTLKKKDLEGIINLLLPKTLKERQKLPGLEPLRADVILSGALLLNEILSYFKQDKVIISDRGLRYGVFCQKYLK